MRYIELGWRRNKSDSWKRRCRWSRLLHSSKHYYSRIDTWKVIHPYRFYKEMYRGCSCHPEGNSPYCSLYTYLGWFVSMWDTQHCRLLEQLFLMLFRRWIDLCLPCTPSRLMDLLGIWHNYFQHMPYRRLHPNNTHHYRKYRHQLLWVGRPYRQGLDHRAYIHCQMLYNHRCRAHIQLRHRTVSRGWWNIQVRMLRCWHSPHRLMHMFHRCFYCWKNNSHSWQLSKWSTSHWS